MMTARKNIQTAITVLLNQEFFKSNGLLLVFRLVVFFEETEVLIQAFGSIKNVKIIFCNYKTIEFMVSQVCYTRQVFAERLEIFHSRFLSLQV